MVDDEGFILSKSCVWLMILFVGISQRLMAIFLDAVC